MPLGELGGAFMPDDVARACRQQIERHQVDWLAQPAGFAPLSVSLRAPSDRDVAGAPAAMRVWLAAWMAFDDESTRGRLQREVCWKSVNWRLMGNVTLPQRVLFASVDAIAACAGMRRHWETLTKRWAALCGRHPALEGKRDGAKALVAASRWADDDFERLTEFLAWGERNPASGLYLRQLPLVGIDTKWIEGRLPVLVPLLQSAFGRDGDIHQLLGLRRAPGTVRMRLLDASLRAQMLGMSDIQMPVEGWNTVFRKPPVRLLVVENMETGLAIPDLADAAVVMGLGNAVTVLQDIAWARAAEILYWGDIDTWGFHILSRARSVFPQLQSVLMTEAVIESHRHLWTTEATQDRRPAPFLTEDEAGILNGLQQGRWGPNVRLEQERVHWPLAVAELSRRWQALHEAAAPAGPSSP